MGIYYGTTLMYGIKVPGDYDDFEAWGDNVPRYELPEDFVVEHDGDATYDDGEEEFGYIGPKRLRVASVWGFHGEFIDRNMPIPTVTEYGAILKFALGYDLNHEEIGWYLVPSRG